MVENDRAGSIGDGFQKWSRILALTWRDSALLGYAAVALALMSWAFHRVAFISAMVTDPGAAGDAQFADIVRELNIFAAIALPFGAVGVAIPIVRHVRGAPRLPLHWIGIPLACTGLPLLFVRMFEYEHIGITGLVMLAIAAALGHAVKEEARRRNWAYRDISARQARLVVLGAWVFFILWMGYQAHQRFITFVPEPYDMSWETNAVHNIVHSGIPKTSVGSKDYYPGQLMPANYANLHTPWIYYLYAPFYALYQDSRALIWLQTVAMGSGALGAYWIARSWLKANWLAALAAVSYLLLPHVQILCMHDVHANNIAIPLLLLSLGLMELRKPYWALAFIFLTSICREETGIYAVSAGLYWALSRPNRLRNKFGWLACAMSATILLLITHVVMTSAGGHPRYGHFTFYLGKPGMASMAKAFLLNPWGAISLILTPMRIDYLWLSLLPFGGLALLGFRAGYFLLIPFALLLPAATGTFWVIGINYSAPIVAPAVILAMAGAREVLLLARRLRAPVRPIRLGLGVFWGTMALLASILYGNIFGKTYKITFGSLPYRQTNELSSGSELGLVTALPPFGATEKALWELIARVPKGVPITTTWRVNPQLSNREVSMLYPDLGQGRPRENRAEYVVVDRLPPLTIATEEIEAEMKAKREFEVFAENEGGILFKRKDSR